MKEPKKEDFGWEDSTMYDEGGWMLEGGEKAYYKALANFEDTQKEAIGVALSFYFLKDNDTELGA